MAIHRNEVGVPEAQISIQESVYKSNQGLFVFSFSSIIPTIILAIFSQSIELIMIANSLFTLLILVWVWKGNFTIVKDILRPKVFNFWTVTRAFILMKVASAGLVLFISAVFPQLIETITSSETSSTLDVILFFLGGVLLIPMIEEFIFRGVSLNAFSQARSTTFAIFLTSILFSLVHGSLGHAIAIFPLGFVAALLTLKTKQLWPAVTLHALNNFLALVLQTDGSELSVNFLYGVLGLIAAFGCLFLAWRWLKEPQKQEQTKPSITIWTPSLITVVIICGTIILINTIAIFAPNTI
jgi:membrane protease YdiL (CAAX protease family)